MKMEKGKEKGEKIPYVLATWIVIVAIIAISIIAIVFRVVTPDVLPANFLGAILGALIGALITFVLLRGQTDVVEKKDKDIKILERKIEVFQKYIEAVWEVWKDQVITIEEFQNLTSQYYQNLMIYLNKDCLKTIGDALSAMGGKIGKNRCDDTKELRGSIVTIINTLSKDINLGGAIDTTIMDKHDEIVFPVLFRNELLNKLNDALNTKDAASEYKEGKYETIWEGKWHEFITFELKKFTGVKLAIGALDDTGYLKMKFRADAEITQLGDSRNKKFSLGLRELLALSNLPNNSAFKFNDGYDTYIPAIDFSKEESMKYFREDMRNFPDILAGRVHVQLDQWKCEELGIIKFLEKYIGQGYAK